VLRIAPSPRRRNGELLGWRCTSPSTVNYQPDQFFSQKNDPHQNPKPPTLSTSSAVSRRSLSPGCPAQTDYAAAQFMKGLLFNNADTGLIVTTDAQLSPEQREVIEAALRNRKRSAGTPDKTPAS
jgi:hypothetical protein